MEQKNYHSSIAAKVSPREAFANIANVAGWWTKSFKGKAQNVGDTFTVEFGKTNVAFEITEAIPDKKIVWHVTDCYLDWLKDKTEWKGTDISWEVVPQNNATRIDMTHVGLVPGIECYESCQKGWNQYVTQSLFKLVTDGKGEPD